MYSGYLFSSVLSSASVNRFLFPFGRRVSAKIKLLIEVLITSMR